MSLNEHESHGQTVHLRYLWIEEKGKCSFNALVQTLLTCGPRTFGVRDAYSGGPRLF
jgi:hypothetical protein